MKRTVLALCVLVLTAACTLQTPIPPTATRQVIARAATLAPTGTRLPSRLPSRTRTATRTHTPTATNSATASATPTSLPTNTPTARATRDLFALETELGSARQIPRTLILNLTDGPPMFRIGINYWVGPFNRVVRQPLLDLNFTTMRWGGVWETVPFEFSQLDRFIEECRKSNVEPLIQVPFENHSPEFAAEMVRYLNVQKKYDVRFWSIGNEADLNKQPGMAEQYIQEFRAYRNAMKAVDERIFLFGPEFGSKYQINTPGQDLLTPFLQVNGDIVDGIALHHYPYGGGLSNMGLVMNNALALGARVGGLREHIRNVTGREIPLAFTEFNFSHNWLAGGEGSSAGFTASMWMAEALGQLADAGTAMVNIWNAHSKDSLGVIHSDTGVVRPVYYAIRLYANYGDRIVPVASQVENVSGHASLDSRTNQTVLVMVNRAKQPAQFQVVFNSNEQQQPGAIYLDRGSTARMDFSMPGESMASLTFDANFKVRESVEYGRDLFREKKGARIRPARP